MIETPATAPYLRRPRALAGLLFAAMLLLAPVGRDARADGTISISQGIPGMPDLGKVVARDNDTYRVDATTGVITFASSNARVGPAVVAVPSYTVECASGAGPANLCGAAPASVTITVQPAKTSDEAFISALNIAVATGPGATACGPVLGQDTVNVSITCTLAPQGDNEKRIVATIRIGTSVTITGSQTRGLKLPAYVISTT
jgi:hypothetical protein